VITVDELATIPLFSALAQNELEYLAGAVEDIHVIPGEYVATRAKAGSWPSWSRGRPS
jgi:thioredoxin reductase (NADPH)